MRDALKKSYHFFSILDIKRLGFVVKFSCVLIYSWGGWGLEYKIRVTSPSEHLSNVGVEVKWGQILLYSRVKYLRDGTKRRTIP